MNNDLKKYFDAQFADQNKKRKLLANILVWPLFIIVIGWTGYNYFTASEDKEYYMIKENYDSQTGDYAKKELDTAKYEEAVDNKKMRGLTTGCILLFFPLMFGGLVFGMSSMMRSKFNAIIAAIENKKIVSVSPVEIHSTLAGKTIAKVKQLIIKTEDKKEYKIFVSDNEYPVIYNSLSEVSSQYNKK